MSSSSGPALLPRLLLAVVSPASLSASPPPSEKMTGSGVGTACPPGPGPGTSLQGRLGGRFCMHLSVTALPALQPRGHRSWAFGVWSSECGGPSSHRALRWASAPHQSTTTRPAVNGFGPAPGSRSPVGLPGLTSRRLWGGFSCSLRFGMGGDKLLTFHPVHFFLI